MRNLKIVQDSRIALGHSENIPALAWDTSTNSVIAAFPPQNESEPVITLEQASLKQDNAKPKTIASWDAPSPNPDLPLDGIVDLHYFGHDKSACLVLAGGDIVVVREQPLEGQEKIEIVGSVDAGISAACWSPDEELLAVTTQANTLLLMTIDFDNVANVTLNAEDAKLSKHVSVGWGKAETQFKGKRARALRDPTMPEKVDEGTLSDKDDGNVTISWRGDGAYVAVNSIETNRRMIRVFTREGVLDSVTEPVDGLEGALSWRPAGNLMAGIQRLADGLKVVFFERNGLRHGEFPLRLSGQELEDWASSIQLAWNVDSTVLAVSFTDRVQLWTMGNYHYYLKQEVKIATGFQRKSLRVLWHPEEPLRWTVPELSFHEQKGDRANGPGERNSQAARVMELFSTVADSSTVPPDDYGTTMVIDGKKLLVTPLRKANVPPPMALHELELENVAIDAAINGAGNRIAVLHQSGITLWSYTPKPATQPALEETIPFFEHDGLLPVQVSILKGDNVVALFKDLNGGLDRLFTSRSQEFHILDSSLESCMFPTVDGNSLCLLNQDKVYEIIKPGLNEPDLPPRILDTFPTPVKTAKAVSHNGLPLIIGLGANGSLYANKRLLVKNCTSFNLTTNHIILTTTNHLLKFIHVAQVDALNIPPDEPEKDERCRSIERGAKIVAVMPSAYSVTLQMPRGNLETIYPRALVLAAIRRNVDSKAYRKAFLACRSQRVDMNIIYDHAPQQFLTNVSLIIDQLSSVEYIDLFLSQLVDDDVSKSLYLDTLPQAEIDGKSGVPNGTSERNSIEKQDGKVNRICDAMLAVLKTRYSTNLQNVITANVCKKPPDIVAALHVVADLRTTNTQLSDDAIEHICFLCDVNQVYEKALGIYSLDLALLVAQQSQKDPREYLPYLQNLQSMSELRRQFSIDDDLGRRDKALLHLHALDAFDELKQYTERHELHTSAIDLYRYDESRQQEILQLYANHLSSRNRFKEAAIVFESLGQYGAATESYQASNMWQEALSCALLVPWSTSEIESLATSLVDALAEVKDYYAAATICRDHLASAERAAQLFCKAYQFGEATRVIARSGQPEMIKTVIDPGLIEASGNATELMADCKNQLNAQIPRLKELREKKARDPLSFLEGGPDGVNGGDIPDNISLAPTDASTSGGTFMTQYTNITRTGASSGTGNTAATRKTSKARRREERKRARGKKGSVYEEEYLVNSIGRLIERVNSVNPDIERLVEGLLRRGMRERADAVNKAMVEVVELCRGCIEEVYEVEKEEEQALERLDGDGELRRPEGGDAVLWDAIQEGKKKRIPPAIKDFEKSPLLSR